MPDPCYVPDSPRLDTAQARDKAYQAIGKAFRLWPGAHGRVLADEIAAAWETLPWLGPNARTWQLIDEILAAPEPQR